MIYVAKFHVKQEWDEEIDLTEDMDRAAGKLYDAVRKRGVILSREMEVALEMEEDLSHGRAQVIVGGFRPVGRISLARKEAQ